MSKAEERSKEIMQAALDYANNLDNIKPTDEFSRNLCIALGQAFIKGAEWADSHKAEKDLELTWEDISEIISIDQQVCGTMGISDYTHNHQQAMEEVLRRFKDLKK